MFKQLRNRFILLNLATTTIILLIAFSSIYLFARNSSAKRQPFPGNEFRLEMESARISISEDTSALQKILEEKIAEDRKNSLRTLLTTLICTGLGVEIVVALFSFYFAEEAIKPVREAYEAHKIFIANASHEIKTPIAAIKANLEAADLSAQNHWIKNIELEADKIEKMNLDLLRLARTDAVKEAITLAPTNLPDLISSLLSSFHSRINQKHLSVKTKFSLENPDKPRKLNQKDLKEILEILLDNAIKYSATKIRIIVADKSITLKNDGATISPDQLPHVFDRFYQTDKSAPGSGLGLAIAKSLANRNHWRLTAVSTKTSTSFTITFA